MDTAVVVTTQCRESCPIVNQFLKATGFPVLLMEGGESKQNRPWRARMPNTSALEPEAYYS